MHKSLSVHIKHGSELTSEEVDSINISKGREWSIPPITEEEKKNNIFFLLKDKSNTIIAEGELLEINGVIFNNEIFNILGIGGIIANVKGEGYGRRLMTEIKNYLIQENKSGIGFTNKFVFYEKCGFLTDIDSLKQFIYIKDGERILNKDDDGIVYFDGQDRFMEKVLAGSTQDVVLPVSPNW